MLIGLLLAMHGHAWARPPRASERCGVLDRVDQRTHSLIVRSPQSGKPLEIVWKNNTRFIWKGKFAPGSLPREGDRICVFYRSPFFGDCFAAKVVWSER